MFFEDDITFCVCDCEHYDCRRNSVNIKHPEYPHSVSDFENTETCPYYNRKKKEDNTKSNAF